MDSVLQPICTAGALVYVIWDFCATCFGDPYMETSTCPSTPTACELGRICGYSYGGGTRSAMRDLRLRDFSFEHAIGCSLSEVDINTQLPRSSKKTTSIHLVSFTLYLPPLLPEQSWEWGLTWQGDKLLSRS